MYIACPRCDWKPTRTSAWRCSCGHVWNSFETHAVCDACGKISSMIQCLVAQGGCGQWSDPDDWYHDENAPTLEEYLADPYAVLNSMSTPDMMKSVSLPSASPSRSDESGALTELFEELQTVFKRLTDLDEEDLATAHRIRTNRPSPTDGEITLIVSIGFVSAEAINAVVDTLRGTFIHNIQFGPIMGAPHEAFNSARQQYRALRLLETLAEYAAPGVFRVIGLIDADVYQPGASFIYGTHLPGSRAILLGLKRLSTPNLTETERDNDSLRRRIAVALVSQVSASLGLSTCPNPGCARSAGQNAIITEQKTAQLCPSCTRKIKNWLK